jgi:hypothetical protein
MKEIMLDTEPTFSVTIPKFQPTELKKLYFIKCLMSVAVTKTVMFWCNTLSPTYSTNSTL